MVVVDNLICGTVYAARRLAVDMFSQPGLADGDHVTARADD